MHFCSTHPFKEHVITGVANTTLEFLFVLPWLKEILAKAEQQKGTCKKARTRVTKVHEGQSHPIVFEGKDGHNTDASTDIPCCPPMSCAEPRMLLTLWFMAAPSTTAWLWRAQ